MRTGQQHVAMGTRCRAKALYLLEQRQPLQALHNAVIYAFNPLKIGRRLYCEICPYAADRAHGDAPWRRRQGHMKVPETLAVSLLYCFRKNRRSRLLCLPPQA